MTLDLESRMFCAIVCLSVEAAAGVVEPLRLRDAEDWVDGSFWSECENICPITAQSKCGENENKGKRVEGRWWWWEVLRELGFKEMISVMSGHKLSHAS